MNEDVEQLMIRKIPPNPPFSKGGTVGICRYLAVFVYSAMFIAVTFMLGACTERDIQDLIERHGVNLQEPVIVIAWRLPR